MDNGKVFIDLTREYDKIKLNSKEDGKEKKKIEPLKYISRYDVIQINKSIHKLNEGKER